MIAGNYGFIMRAIAATFLWDFRAHPCVRLTDGYGEFAILPYLHELSRKLNLTDNVLIVQLTPVAAIESISAVVAHDEIAAVG